MKMRRRAELSGDNRHIDFVKPVAMADNKERLQEPKIQEPRRFCVTCAAPLLTHTILNPRKGKTIHLYSCPQCGRVFDAATGNRTRMS